MTATLLGSVGRGCIGLGGAICSARTIASRSITWEGSGNSICARSFNRSTAPGPPREIVFGSDIMLVSPCWLVIVAVACASRNHLFLSVMFCNQNFGCQHQRDDGGSV